LACGKTFEVKTGEYAGTVWKMPEYESIYAFGPMQGNLDPASLIKAEELCDQYGLDTISHGGHHRFRPGMPGGGGCSPSGKSGYPCAGVTTIEPPIAWSR